MQHEPVKDDLYGEYIENVRLVRAASFYRDALRIACESATVRDLFGELRYAELPTGGIHNLLEGTPMEQRVTKKLLDVTSTAFGTTLPED